MRVVSIDPGKRHIGWALWGGGEGYSQPESRLASCGLFRFEKWSELSTYVTRVLRPDRMICEMPQVYQLSKSEGDPNDLIHLALTSGVCLGTSGQARAVLPREWKKTTDPDVVERRIRKRMDAHGPFVMGMKEVPKSLQHNTVDAVGLGLWWFVYGGER